MMALNNACQLSNYNKHKRVDMSTFTSGSSSYKPDLDWSQLKETILMLNLAISQIDQSMNEGNSSVTTLSGAFTGIATMLSDIQLTIDQLTNKDASVEELQLSIQDLTSSAFDKVQSAIIAFQFYDKLTQRLDHVSGSLGDLTSIISDPELLYSPVEWRGLQESIRSKYTMAEERNMFDKVISGTPIEQALAEFREEILVKEESNEEDEDDIELF